MKSGREAGACASSGVAGAADRAPENGAAHRWLHRGHGAPVAAWQAQGRTRCCPVLPSSLRLRCPESVGALCAYAAVFIAENHEQCLALTVRRTGIYALRNPSSHDSFHISGNVKRPLPIFIDSGKEECTLVHPGRKSEVHKRGRLL